MVTSALRDRWPLAGWGNVPPAAYSDSPAVGAVVMACAGEAAKKGISSAEMYYGDWAAVSPQDVAMNARWASSPQVYDFDSDLADAVIRTGLGNVPSEAVSGLPYSIQYVRCRMDEYDGFLAWLDHAADGGTVSDVLTVVMLHRNSYGRARLVVPLSGTMGDLAGAMRADETVNVWYAEVPTTSAAELEAHKQRMAGLFSNVLSLLLYVCSVEADVEVVYQPPTGKRGQRTGRRTNPETVRAVGARVGRALGTARMAYASGPERGGNVSPHVRRAHWQHFWVGPRKGRTDGRYGDRLIVKWIPPIAVLGGGGAEVVHHTGKPIGQR
ncbi:hypothetical protein BHK98_09215 [Hornefia porci]|uniref:Uncharacterized protein n=1 Tax=Hornefia porci TaxID=2652292 RepID=A0A1Q9JJB9_9FIRM|nr:hypothetical protein BHK98_09215 [Hornefia porci]